jgi:anaerobic C4-dicarboxylate transporter
MSRADDIGSGPPSQLTGLDGWFTKTPTFVVSIVLAVIPCCSLIGLILGIVGLIVCKDPTARRNAIIVTAIGAVIVVIGAILSGTGAIAIPQMQGR